MEYKRIVKYTLNLGSLLPGNMRVLAIRDVLIAISTSVTGGLDALYVKNVLGADAVTLGMLASLWSFSFLVSIWISGWLSSYYDQKKLMAIGTALTVPNPLILALTPDWRLTIAVNVLAALGTAFVAPSKTSLLFSNSKQENRSRSIAMITTLTNLANSVVPPLGAIAVQQMGGLNELRKIFFIQFAISVVVLIYTWKALKEEKRRAENRSGRLVTVIKGIFTQLGEVYKTSRERKVRAWLFLSLTGPWAWEIIGPFWMIYAAEECKVPISILGLLTSFYSLTTVILLLPLAHLSDKKGRKKAIILTRPFLYLCILTLLLGGTLKSLWFIPVLAWVFKAIGDSSSPSWTAASTEAIPEELQGKWEAARDFLWRIMAIPAGTVGGLLWNIDPRLPFLFTIIVDGLLRLPALIYFIPETLIVQRFRPKQLGRHIVLYGLSGSGQTSIARQIKRSLMAEEVIDEKAVRIPKKRFSTLSSKRRRIIEILNEKEKTVIVEGEPAVFAAEAEDKATIVLLVASKDERVRRKLDDLHEPEFIVYRTIEERDRKLSKMTKRLYGADLSKLPPFDIAINTDRVSLDKAVEIIALLHKKRRSKV